jgi:hypothetical protein
VRTGKQRICTLNVIMKIRYISCILPISGIGRAFAYSFDDSSTGLV